MKVMSSFRFARKQYKHIVWSEQWALSFGYLEKGASVLAYGGSGNGKTEFCCQFAAEMSRYGKVMYLSWEQGASSSLQQAFKRNGLLRNKQVRLVEHASVKEIKETIKKRNPPLLMVLDSLDVMRVKWEEMRELMEVAKGRTVLLSVARADGHKPNKQLGIDVMYDSEVKVHIRKYVAFVDSRYGGSVAHIIHPERAAEHHSFLNRGRKVGSAKAGSMEGGGGSNDKGKGEPFDDKGKGKPCPNDKDKGKGEGGGKPCPNDKGGSNEKTSL